MSTSTQRVHLKQIPPDNWPWRRLTVSVDGERYIATVSEGPENWSAHITRLPGLVVTGSYVAGRLDAERVREQLSEAVRFHLGS